MLSLPIRAVFEEERDVCTAILTKDGEIVAQVMADADGEFPQVDLEPGEYMVRVLQNDEPGAFDHDEKGRCSGRMTIRLDPPWFDALEARVDDLEKRVTALENVKPRTTNLERAIQEAQARAEAAEAELAKARYEEPEQAPEPPEDLADLFDANLTARQNQEALTKKYAHHMSEYTRLRDYGDEASRSQASEHLKKAQRYESGIAWNRPRLAEVI